jgi:hypothetical protein
MLKIQHNHHTKPATGNVEIVALKIILVLLRRIIVAIHCNILCSKVKNLGYTLVNIKCRRHMLKSKASNNHFKNTRNYYLYYREYHRKNVAVTHH